VFHC